VIGEYEYWPLSAGILTGGVTQPGEIDSEIEAPLETKLSDGSTRSSPVTEVVEAGVKPVAPELAVPVALAVKLCGVAERQTTTKGSPTSPPMLPVALLSITPPALTFPPPVALLLLLLALTPPPLPQEEPIATHPESSPLGEGGARGSVVATTSLQQTKRSLKTTSKLIKETNLTR
jgi:hypothetical protein